MDRRIPMLALEAVANGFETSSQNRPCSNAGGTAANEAEVLCAILVAYCMAPSALGRCAP
jgi:hypothetical protein